MFPGSGFWNKVREMVYRLALEIITATKPLSTRAIFKVLFQILTSCVGNHYYNILYVYWIKHIYFINVWFQNNHRQLNISACISNSAYLIPQMRRARCYGESYVHEFSAVDFPPPKLYRRPDKSSIAKLHHM